MCSGYINHEPKEDSLLARSNTVEIAMRPAFILEVHMDMVS